MGWALGEVWDVKARITDWAASPTWRFSLFEGLQINLHFSDHLKLIAKDIWMMRGGGGWVDDVDDKTDRA